MAEQVLFVDDDPNILRAIQRNFRKHFETVTAAGPGEALAILRAPNSIGVIVSDFKMPGMNGVEFLSQTVGRWPNVVRILLTGEADTKAAISAVNQGQVYRFLTKPCPPTILETTVLAALKQFRTAIAEKELLENTLGGVLKVLTEILSLAHPLVF